MSRRLAVLHGLLIGGVAFALFRLTLEPPGHDAYAYWSVDLANIYAGYLGGYGFFPYSPAAAIAAFPLRVLPWEAYLLVWWTTLALAVRWMAGSWKTFVYAMLAAPVLMELVTGNIHLLLGAAVVAGFRWPAAWAFVLLTKITPGIGLLWFVVRREWGALGIAIGATSLIAAASFLLLPGAWLEWLAMLGASSGATQGLPLLDRVVVAALLIVWGAPGNRRWTVVVGATLALPLIWPSSVALLVGLASSHVRQPLREAGEIVVAAPAGPHPNWSAAPQPGKAPS